MGLNALVCSLVLPWTNIILKSAIHVPTCYAKQKNQSTSKCSDVSSQLWYNDLHTFRHLQYPIYPPPTRKCRRTLVLISIFIFTKCGGCWIWPAIYCFGKFMHCGNLDRRICHSFVPTLAYCYPLVGVSRKNSVCCLLAGYIIHLGNEILLGEGIFRWFGAGTIPVKGAAMYLLRNVLNAMQCIPFCQSNELP